ncbi:MAG: hypothetical protein ABIH09_01225, partial [Candidatus Omnitrophota bacterium]
MSTYDKETGNMESSVKYWDNGTIAMRKYYKEETGKCYMIYKYDEETGKRTSSTNFFDNGNISSSRRYDKETGNCYSENHYDQGTGNRCESIYHIAYDEYGNSLKQEIYIYDPQSNNLLKYQEVENLQYDNQGNIIKQKIYTYDKKGGTLLKVEEREYPQDKGEWKQKIIFKEEHNRLERRQKQEDFLCYNISLSPASDSIKSSSNKSLQEILQKKQIETRSHQQMTDPRFCGKMIGKEMEAVPSGQKTVN